MLSLLNFLVYAGLGFTLAAIVAPYILRMEDQRVQLYAGVSGVIIIIAALVALHFLVELCLDLILGFHLSDLFSMKTAVFLIFGFLVTGVLRTPVTYYRKFV